MNGDRSWFDDDQYSLLIISMNDLDWFVRYGGFVSMDAVADLISISNDLMDFSFTPVDGTDAFVDCPDVVLFRPIAELGSHDLDQLAAEPSELAIRLEFVPIRCGFAKALDAGGDATTRC